MLGSRLARLLAMPALCTCLLLAPVAHAAEAGAPATVTVRVEGPSSTLLAATTVTTTTAPVIKDGNPSHTCPGTTAAGALDLATHGSWNGAWFSGFGYSVETIEGQSFPFTQPYYWSFWLDGKASSVGICEAQLHDSDSILFFPECFSETAGECPAGLNPLEIQGPASAEVGVPSTFTVISRANVTGAATPAGSATVQDAEERSPVSTDAAGHATLVFARAGEHTVQVSAPGAVRSETHVCVHAGNDGTCGTSQATEPTGSTSAPVSPVSSSSGSSGSSSSSSGVAGFTTSGPAAVIAQASGPTEGHVYARGQAPRVIGGSVRASGAIASLRIELRRRFKGRCFAYSGSRERFARSRCGRPSYFPIPAAPAFSYLLPFALAPGRYVFDIQAVATSGQRTRLERDRSRIVFYVR